MLVDSHCHVDFPELAGRIEDILDRMRSNHVDYALCAAVTLERLPAMLELVERYPQFFASVGVHPDNREGLEASADDLVQLAEHPKVVAIGETGLDYYRLEGDLEWQRERFRTHIRAAIDCSKPLIIHTREAAADTLNIMREEQADKVGGVMHCFTESKEVAEAALGMGFYISISGIVTFKNASQVREVARFVPLDRLLIETDSPYLAPVPYRGKTNEPGFVQHVAEEIAKLRGIGFEALASATTQNFFRLFSRAQTALP
jgi:TatD DNase family protein